MLVKALGQWLLQISPETQGPESRSKALNQFYKVSVDNKNCTEANFIFSE